VYPIWPYTHGRWLSQQTTINLFVSRCHCNDRVAIGFCTVREVHRANDSSLSTTRTIPAISSSGDSRLIRKPLTPSSTNSGMPPTRVATGACTNSRRFLRTCHAPREHEWNAIGHGRKPVGVNTACLVAALELANQQFCLALAATVRLGKIDVANAHGALARASAEPTPRRWSSHPRVEQ